MGRRVDYGQMNKWFELRSMIHGADVIIEIVDARDIEGTRLLLAEKWSGSKRLLVLVNKTDLAAELPAMPARYVTISAKSADEKDRRRVIAEIMKRSSSRPIRALLVGYPNVGKSSIINMLARKKAARVSPVAGTTKAMQWIRINDELVVSDYRGMFPNKEPKGELVRKGALNIQGKEDEYAYEFAKKILGSKLLTQWLEKRFGLELDGVEDPEQLLIRMAERRGWYLKGGEPNIQEAARSLVRAMKDAPEIK